MRLAHYRQTLISWGTNKLLLSSGIRVDVTDLEYSDEAAAVRQELISSWDDISGG